AAFGYLPLALLAVTIAAPLTMLLLSASDQMAAVVSSAAGHQSAGFLDDASGVIGALTRLSESPFLAFFAGLLTVAAAMALWLELMVRAAAVYVIVLLLPLAFAAFVWPARRVWAIRSVELLVALILSKFVIVAVLSLGGAAFSQSVLHSVSGMLAGVALLTLGAFAPWALLKLLPVTELASAAAGSLRHDAKGADVVAGGARAQANEGELWATKAAQMRREANEAETLDAADPAPEPQATSDVAPPGDPAAAAPAVAAADAVRAPAPAQRIPGMPGMWQAENGTWNPVVLGPEFSRVWPSDGADERREQHEDDAAIEGPDTSPPPQDAPGEDL
ncbi:MAG TPA: hypothetical protein VMP89_12250, partial [Solirubrobacteraceae bacterium]|nr:hypothetical protein [Solirubrobacteraceae bacterium]